jgi:hypothetical protein
MVPAQVIARAQGALWRVNEGAHDGSKPSWGRMSWRLSRRCPDRIRRPCSSSLLDDEQRDPMPQMFFAGRVPVGWPYRSVGEIGSHGYGLWFAIGSGPGSRPAPTASKRDR